MDKKIQLFLILGLFMINFASAFDWSDNIFSYHKLDETTGTIAFDHLGLNNLTNNGVTINQAGKINTAYVFADTTNLKNNTPIALPIGASNRTICSWVYPTTASDDYLWAYGDTSLRQFWSIAYLSGTQFDVVVDGDDLIGSGTHAINNWYYVCATYDGTTTSLFVNGINEGNKTQTLNTVLSDLFIGTHIDGDKGLIGTQDEIGIWNRSLTSSEILELYNEGNGLPFGDVISQNVELVSPENGTTVSDIGANFTTVFNITGENIENHNWKNATYYVWKDGADFNQTTVTLSGNSTNYTLFIDSFTLADYEWNVYGCYGNVSYNNCTWSSNGNFTLIVGASITSETYDNNSYETSTNLFEINATLLSGVVIQAAYLYYDDVRYVGNVTSIGNGEYSMSMAINTPLLNGATENRSFYWSFVYTSPVQKTQNTTINNQTVMPIFFGACNATYTVHAIDMDIKEEATFNELNGTLEFAANYWLGDGALYKELTFANLSENASSFDFCISPEHRTFNIDDIISYTKTGYERRDAFLSNAQLTNNTMNLSLYLALTNATDIFTITVQDQASKAVSGAFVNVQRWDIGTNNFYTVAVIKTTSDGTGIVNIRLNDAYYRYQVYYNNVLYLTTDPVKEAGTSRILEINLEEANPYDKFNDIDYSLTYDNETNVSVFTYADTTGAVAIGCLKVLKMEGSGTTEVYYSCVESSSGTLSHQITDDGTYIIRAIFRLGPAYDNIEKVVDEIIRQGKSARFQIIGAFGQIISLFVIGTSAAFGVAIGSIPLGLGAIAASLVLVNLLGWLNISSSVIYGIISIIILIAINLRRGK